MKKKKGKKEKPSSTIQMPHGHSQPKGGMEAIKVRPIIIS
jgi:hypothetical protein